MGTKRGRASDLLTTRPCHCRPLTLARLAGPSLILAGEPAIQYFQGTFPELRRLRPAEGLADFLIEVTTATEGSPQPDFAGAYAASELAAANEKALQDVIAEYWADAGANGGEPGGPGRLAALLRFDRNYGTVMPMWRALLVLWRYRSLHSFKRFAYIGPRMLDKVCRRMMMRFLSADGACSRSVQQQCT